MEEEKSEVRRLGEVGGSTAKVTVETRDQSHESVRQANGLLERAGEKIRPYGCRYVGSAAIHYYVESESETKPVFQTVSQTLVSKVDEHLADFGWKELKNALMKAYGRTIPRIRQ